MRSLSKLLLGSLGLAALAGTAMAADRVHVLNVALPDGSIRQVRYTGDVAPRVVLVPISGMVPAMADPFDNGGPFAMLDRIAATMDAQASAMVRQAAMASQATSGGMPASAALPGMVSYSYSSFTSTAGGKGCARSVQLTSFGSGHAPQVVRRSSGDCSAVAARAVAPAAERAAPAPTPSPIIPARYVPAPAKAKLAPVI